MFQVNPLLGRGFTWKIKPYFLRKIKVKIKMSSAAILFGALRVNIRTQHVLRAPDSVSANLPILYQTTCVTIRCFCRVLTFDSSYVLPMICLFPVLIH